MIKSNFSYNLAHHLTKNTLTKVIDYEKTMQ